MALTGFVWARVRYRPLKSAVSYMTAFKCKIQLVIKALYLTFYPLDVRYRSFLKVVSHMEKSLGQFVPSSASSKWLFR